MNLDKRSKCCAEDNTAIATPFDSPVLFSRCGGRRHDATNTYRHAQNSWLPLRGSSLLVGKAVWISNT